MTVRVPGQAARDAAYPFRGMMMPVDCGDEAWNSGAHDENALVQAFAAFEATARKQALEEAAKVADDFAQRNARAGFDFDADENRIIATAIRAIGSQNDG